MPIYGMYRSALGSRALSSIRTYWAWFMYYIIVHPYVIMIMHCITSLDRFLQ